MEEYTFGVRWLAHIEDDIKQKYKIFKARFIINNVEFHLKDKIVDWIDEKLIHFRWIRYKKIGDDLFELKDFFADPSEQICKQIVQDFFDRVHYINEGLRVYYKIDKAFFDKKEAWQEVFLRIRSGCSEVYLDEILDYKTKGYVVYDISVGEMELYHKLSGGYVNLEFKDED